MKGKAIYTRKLGAAVASQAKGSVNPKYHVISSEKGGWEVVSDQQLIPVRTFSSKRSAVSFAKKCASADAKSIIVVHEEDGSVAKRIPSITVEKNAIRE